MKKTFFNLSSQSIFIILLSTISLFLLKWFYYLLIPASSSSFQNELNTTLKSCFVSILIILFFKKFHSIFSKNSSFYLLVYFLSLVFLSFCSDISFHYRALPFSSNLFCVENYIFIVAILTPVYVESIFKYSYITHHRYFYILSGYLIIIGESSLSASLKPALFHAIVFTFSWLYFMKKDYLLVTLCALSSIFFSALNLEIRWTASHYISDIFDRFSKINTLWSNQDSVLSATINKIGLTPNVYYYLAISGFLLLTFTFIIAYMILYISKVTHIKAPVIGLLCWIILLLLQVLNQLGILPFEFMYMFYGAGNYYIFLYMLTLHKYISISNI